MASYEQYEQVPQIQVNGRTIGEATSISFDSTKNKSTIVTTKGIGFSVGHEQVSGTLDSAVPRAGFEQDFYELMQEDEQFTILQLIGGKRIQYKVVIDSISSSQAPESPTSFTVSFSGVRI